MHRYVDPHINSFEELFDYAIQIYIKPYYMDMVSVFRSQVILCSLLTILYFKLSNVVQNYVKATLGQEQL